MASVSDTKINVIFPMAGDATRFGWKFKPFLRLGDMTFIEHAVAPFYKWKHLINKVYFVYRRDQEIENNVSEYLLNNIDSSVEVVPVILEEKTSGPRQTISEALAAFNIERGIVCDCDHKIDVDKLFEKIVQVGFEKAVIPVWKIDENESHNWSKVVSDGAEIVDIVEKEDVDFSRYNVWGILGCIYFPDLSRFNSTDGSYVSDVCKSILNSKDEIVFCEVDNAYFFGDPKMLQDCVNRRRGECSVFCDIDGVLLKHKDHSSNNPGENVPLLNNIKAINELSSDNHKIILTTARSSKYKDGLEKLLSSLGVSYDYLVCGLASGPRVLINDRKPSKPFTQQASAFENYRNESLSLDIKSILDKNNEIVLEDLSENSGAKTFLITNGSNKFVRKIVKKSDKGAEKHVAVLKRQALDLERFNLFSEGVSPRVLGRRDNSIEFYIDMEFLEGYKKLSLFDCKTKRNVLKKVMTNMKNNIYCYSKEMTEQESKKKFNTFIAEKIIKKLDNFSSQSKIISKLINDDFVLINGKKYHTLRNIFNDKNIDAFRPKSLGPVHGDLTLENILYNMIKDDYSLIDMDGAAIMDTNLLDLGKLSQSMLARYGEWKEVEPEISYENGEFKCDSSWFDFSEEDMNFLQDVWPFDGDCSREAIFYMCTYFIRFVPFRMSKGFDHGLFALIMAVVWMNKLNLGGREWE